MQATEFDLEQQSKMGRENNAVITDNNAISRLPFFYHVYDHKSKDLPGNKMSVGNPLTPFAATMSPKSPMVASTLATFGKPSELNKLPSCSNVGANCLQWPHHGAVEATMVPVSKEGIPSVVKRTHRRT